MEVDVLSGDPYVDEGIEIVTPVIGSFKDNLEWITVNGVGLEIIW